MTLHTIAMGGDEDAKRMIREQTEELRNTPVSNARRTLIENTDSD